MSAPAGWHLQPDGQERYWDGTAWTDEFRAPLPSDPTAPPSDPSWAASVDETQALDVDHTQAIPAPAQPAAPIPPAYQQPGYPQAYQQPEYPPQQAGYPQQQPGYPQTGYGAPGSQPYGPPPRQGGSGLAKGCLIVAIIGVLVLGAVVVGGIYVFNKASTTISDTFPSGFPTDLPSDFPSDLPSEGLGDSIGVTVGDSFDLPRATIESGWSLEAKETTVVNIVGMQATLSSDADFPVLFTMSFPAVGGDMVETVCTASGSAGETVDVSCVPLFGEVADATSATVTASL